MDQFLADPGELYGRLVPGYRFTLAWDGTTAVLYDEWSDTVELAAVPTDTAVTSDTYLRMVRVTNEILSRADEHVAAFVVQQDGGDGRTAVYLCGQQGLFLVTFVD